MGIVKARVRDFQSVADCEIKFGKFTVLEGPSSSGKSAWLRGIRACVRNSSVPSNVRKGKTKAVIDITLDDAEVGIERGKSLSTYKLNGQVFTKSGKSVPEEISKALKFPLIEGLEATFSFQFDKPFLLSESGATAGQAIGSLTNVSLLHSAVREANRRRLESASVLKVRKSDLERQKEQAKQFSGLPTRKKVVGDAERLLGDAKRLEVDSHSLESLVSDLRSAEGVLEGLQATRPADVSELLAEAQRLLDQTKSLEGTVFDLNRLEEKIKKMAVLAKSLKVSIEKCVSQYNQELAEAGLCPTCGQHTGEESLKRS